MNFDDKFTKQFEEKFQKNLEAIRSIPPETHQIIEDNLKIIYEFIEKLKSKPDKSPEDFELLASLHIKLKELYQSFEDMKLILGESLYRKSVAFYEHVKKLAKDGDKEAEKVYNNLKTNFEKFDAN